MEFNGLLHTLPHRTPLQPYATYFVLLVITVLTLTNGFDVFFPSQWSVSNFLAAYITLPIFFALYLGHKIYFAVYQVRKGKDGDESGPAWIWAEKIPNIDVLPGKREMDELEAMDEARVPRNWAEKLWYWLA